LTSSELDIERHQFTMTRSSVKPLDHVTVVSLEHAIAAPFCTRQLADLGARVIKIERPEGGDFARGYDQRARGASSHFVWVNRSKESLALDLALTPELIESGLVREVIRAIQEERKHIGLDVSDRITVNWNAPEQVAKAIASAIEEIGAEVLATKFNHQTGESNSENELGLWLNLVKN
jgi:hypothetical protein